MKSDLTLRTLSPEPVSFADVDNNFERLAYYSGNWVAGTYTANEVVKYLGGVYICTAPSTTQDPYTGLATDWDLIGTTPGRGGMSKTGPVAGADITAAYQTLTFDTDYPFEFGVITEPAAGTMQLTHPGLWQFGLLMSFGHDEQNASRQTRVRLWNVTDGTGGTGITIPVSRNQPSSFVAFTVLTQVAAADLNDVFRWEIGGGDTLSSVIWENCDTQLIQISAV